MIDCYLFILNYYFGKLNYITVPVEENIRQFESSLMQSENLSFPLPDEVLSGPSELDEKVASLDRAIQGAVQDVLLYKVEIGNIRDIETTIRNGKVRQKQLSED